MSDDVLFAADDVDQIPKNVQQRLVRLLNAVDAEAGDGEAVIADLRHAAAVAAGEADGEQAQFAGRLKCAVDVGRLATRRYSQGDVARPAQQLELLHERQGEVLVV